VLSRGLRLWGAAGIPAVRRGVLVASPDGAARQCESWGFGISILPFFFYFSSPSTGLDWSFSFFLLLRSKRSRSAAKGVARQETPAGSDALVARAGLESVNEKWFLRTILIGGIWAAETTAHPTSRHANLLIRRNPTIHKSWKSAYDHQSPQTDRESTNRKCQPPYYPSRRVVSVSTREFRECKGAE
jgi:hypothetical protein